MEYCAGGSMSDLYEATKKTVEEVHLREIIAFSVLGLHHLHINRSIHRVSILIILCNIYKYILIHVHPSTWRWYYLF